jgi:hypothetical protein
VDHRGGRFEVGQSVASALDESDAGVDAELLRQPVVGRSATGMEIGSDRLGEFIERGGDPLADGFGFRVRSGRSADSVQARLSRRTGQDRPHGPLLANRGALRRRLGSSAKSVVTRRIGSRYLEVPSPVRRRRRSARFG